MAELIFDCPACNQAVQADDAWTGMQIECPICHAPIVVPSPVGASQIAPPPAPVSGPRLVREGGSTKSPVGKWKHQSRFDSKGKRTTNLAVRYALIAVVVVALAAGGWFGWPHLKPHLPFLKTDQAAETAASEHSKPAGETARAEPAPVAPVEVPMTPPSYTLDVQQATISAGRVNGTIAGTNFVADSIRLDRLASGYVLTMRQGAGQTPDRGLRVYLQMKPTDFPTGQVWTVSPDLKGTAISRIVKVWKTNPKYSAQETAYSTGFALKLEFGSLTSSNTLSGKIFAALPDKDQSVVGGTFEAATPLGNATETPAQSVPPAIQNAESESQKAEFQKRYGIRR